LPIPKVSYTSHILEKYVEKRKLRALRKCGVLISPLVPAPLAVKASHTDCHRYFLNIENNLPDSKLSAKYQCSFDAYRAFYVSVHLYWKGYERPTFIDKNVCDLKIAFLKDPDYFCVLLKNLFNSFRAEVIGGKRRIDNILSYFYPEECNSYNKLQASGCLRALPQYTGSISGLLDQTVERWCTPSDVNLNEWKVWITQWCRFYKPHIEPDFFPFIMAKEPVLSILKNREA